MNRTNSQSERKDHSIERSSVKEVDDSHAMSTLNRTNEDFKYEIPPACFVSMMKKTLIDKMKAKYFLASHPYPKIDGELMIFKPMKADQTLGPEIIVYRDYSLCKRIETTPKQNFVQENLKNKKKSKDAKK
jgi:transposase